MSIFDSKSSSDTEVYETGQQASDQGQAFSLNDVKAKGGGDINITATDYGAITEAMGFVDDALEFTAGATMEVIGASDRARGDALDYGAGVTMAAFDYADAARVDAYEFTAGAFKEATASNARAIQETRDAYRDALAGTRDSQRDALEFTAGGLQAIMQANENANEFNTAAFSQAMGAYDNALSTVEKASQSDTRRLSEQMMYALFALVGLLAWRASQ